MEFETECQKVIDKLIDDKQTRAGVLRAVKKMLQTSKKS